VNIRVGLIGAGGIAGAHLRGYQQITGQAEVAAVADVEIERARQRAAEAGEARAFADYGDMLATADLDAVDICLPHHLHADAIIAAARAGKAILCEKPLCLTVDEAKAVREAVTDAGVTLMCAHNQLHLPAVERARQMVADGALGTVYELRTTDSFHHTFNAANMGWRAHRSLIGGGELIDTGYHPTYLLLHLAGSEPTEVTAMLSRHRLEHMDGEDSARVLVRFASGAVGEIVTSWAYDPAPGTERFSLVGDKGSLASDGRVLTYRAHRQDPGTATELAEVDTFAAEVADFVACVREGRRPLNTEEEGIAVLKVILAAYRSAEEKRVIALADLS
jgi:predicted dehydrogenase